MSILFNIFYVIFSVSPLVFPNYKIYKFFPFFDDCCMRFYDLPKYYEGHAQVNTDCSSSLSTSYKV